MSSPGRGPGRAGHRRAEILARASLLSAAGTVASRLTGMLRLLMVAYVLGGNGAADSFNLANNTPNIINDLVLGGVLAATFVPVFVETLARRERRQAMESISAVITLAGVVLVVATVLFELGAPAIIHLYTLGTPPSTEQHLAVTLLRWFAPQLLGYGAIGVMAAVLATDDRFAVVGIVPVLNNVISIVVLWVFASLDHAVLRGAAPDPGLLLGHPALVAFLGIGTTVGILVQAIALVPSLRRAHLGLHFVWRPGDAAVRRIVSLSGWTFGFVVANQVAVFVVLALAARAKGWVSAYTYAFTFFQLPFGVIAASIVNVATPDLARADRASDATLFGRRFGATLRRIIAVVMPAMVVYLILAQPITTILLRHRAESLVDANLTASVLALFALGLPGFCIYFWTVRAFQAMQDTRTAFSLYLLENGLNVALAFALYRPLGVRGLALSYSIAYTVAALAALSALQRRIGSIGGRELASAAGRALGLSVVMAVVLALAVTITGTPGGLGGWIRLAFVLVVGGAVYFGGAGLAGTLSDRRSDRRARRRHGARRTHRDDQGGD